MIRYDQLIKYLVIWIIWVSYMIRTNTPQNIIYFGTSPWFAWFVQILAPNTNYEYKQILYYQIYQQKDMYLYMSLIGVDFCRTDRRDIHDNIRFYKKIFIIFFFAFFSDNKKHHILHILHPAHIKIFIWLWS